MLSKSEVSEISVISEGTGSLICPMDGLKMVGIHVAVRIELFGFTVRVGNIIGKLQCCRDKIICGSNFQAQALVLRNSTK
jgi:hypothetical protein